MLNKHNITIDKVNDKRKVRHFNELAASYREMATDKEREAEAMAWSEGTLGDIDYETR
ncbi:MAG: hypothetical protein WC748_01945 [Legionellales bacterium]|jgi:hypothetical protein